MSELLSITPWKHGNHLYPPPLYSNQQPSAVGSRTFKTETDSSRFRFDRLGSLENFRRRDSEAPRRFFFLWRRRRWRFHSLAGPSLTDERRGGCSHTMNSNRLGRVAFWFCLPMGVVWIVHQNANLLIRDRNRTSIPDK